MQTGGHGSKRRRYEDAIAALLQTVSVYDAARQIGLSQTTLLKWMREPVFIAAYADARKQIVDAAIARVQRLCAKAATKLEETLDDPDTTPAIRIQACKLTFDMSLKALELAEITERLQRIEEHLSLSKETL